MENVTTVIPFLQEGLVEEPARALYPSEDIDAPTQGDELRFFSDKEGPNVSWAWSHHNQIAFWYFESYLEGFREWAYVMWDLRTRNDWVGGVC
jgi:hypothetical protein